MNEHEWETFNETNTSITSRLKIEGGWLYYVSASISTKVLTTMCFVPDSPSTIKLPCTAEMRKEGM